MAEEKEVKQDKEPKKGKKAKGGKKGKLPVLVVLITVLAAGGYFGMKMSKGGAPTEPSLELGDLNTHAIDLGEYMVNTADGKSFLKAKIVVHLAEGTSLFGATAKGESPGVEALAPYVDAVREVLSAQSVANLTSDAGEAALKAQIAQKVNQLYARRHPKDAKSLPKKVTDKDQENWDSKTGPVLNVYLTDLIWEN